MRLLVLHVVLSENGGWTAAVSDLCTPKAAPVRRQVAATDPASASSAESEAEAESGAEAGPSDADSVASEHSFSRSATACGLLRV